MTRYEEIINDLRNSTEKLSALKDRVNDENKGYIDEMVSYSEFYAAQLEQVKDEATESADAIRARALRTIDRNISFASRLAGEMGEDDGRQAVEF